MIAPHPEGTKRIYLCFTSSVGLVAPLHQTNTVLGEVSHGPYNGLHGLHGSSSLWAQGTCNPMPKQSRKARAASTQAPLQGTITLRSVAIGALGATPRTPAPALLDDDDDNVDEIEGFFVNGYLTPRYLLLLIAQSNKVCIYGCRSIISLKNYVSFPLVCWSILICITIVKL